MTKGLLKAARMLEIAKSDIPNWKVDDIYLADSCMHVHYGIEACLRHVATMSGINELTGHSLPLHLNNVSLQLQKYNWYDDLLELSNYTRDWHAGFMYLSDFVETEHNVRRAMNILENMIKDLEYYTPINNSDITIESKIQSILDRNRTGLNFSDIKDIIPATYLKLPDVSIQELNDVVMMVAKSYFVNRK